MGALSKTWAKEEVLQQSAGAMAMVLSPPWCRSCADVV